MWISSNGKWKITNIEEKGEANYKVHATRTMRNDKNWLLIVNMLGNYEFMESNLGKANLPKYVIENAVRLVEQIKENDMKVIAPEVKKEEIEKITSAADLEKIASEFLQENYNMELEIPININGRLSRALGRFDYYRHGRKAVKIHISKKLVDYHPVEDVIDTLKHELVHYAVFSNNKGQEHRDGHEVFESELKRLGIGRTGTLKGLHPKHVYSCTGCNKPENEIKRNSRLNLKRNYTTRCCDAPLKYEGLKQESPEQ